MWNLAVLRQHIKLLDPEHQYLIEVVDSIGRGTDIFRYHLFNARGALNDLIDEDEPAGPKSLEYVLGASEQQQEYNYAKLSSEANLISCMHTVRNQWNIFAQLVNGLVLVPPIEVDACSITKVVRSAPESRLKDELGNVLASDWFNYILGFINTAKHRKLIQHGFFVSFEENVSGIKIGAFEYGGRTFPQHWSAEVLQGAVDVQNAIVSCGRTLNELCGVGNGA